MEKLFLSVLSMSGTASAVILMVLLARLALRRAPKVFSYALWAVVLFRLLCPFAIESAFSLTPRVQVRSGDRNDFDMVTVDVERREVTITVDDAPAALPQTPEAYTPENPGVPDLTRPDASVTAASAVGRWTVAGIVWLAGAGLLMGYSLLSLLRLRRKLVGSVPLAGEENVRLADHIPSPFVLGLVRPQIYLPSGLPERERDYVLLHERTHIRRFDHVTRALAWLALAVHWFNPLVWLAFYLAGKDMEMSCDETVLRKMGREIRADYSSSLLRLSVGGSLPAGPLAFGGGSLTSRIKNVLGYKKPALWMIGLALIVVVCAGTALATNFGGVQGPSGSGLEDLSADLTFSLGEEGTTVRIEGVVDGLELEHTLWTASSWYEPHDDIRYPLGELWFEMPFCGGEVGCELDARWTDESRSAVRVTATPRMLLSSYAPSGNLFFTVDLSDGTLLELEGYIPKLHAAAPERVPTEAEAVRAARIAALLLKEAESFYKSSAATGPAAAAPSEPSSDPAGLPWEVPEAENAPSYEDYFAQVIDYHYPGPYEDEDWRIIRGGNLSSYMLVYREPDLYLSEYYDEWSGDQPDKWLRKIAEVPGLDVFCYDEAWIYAVVNGGELIRMNYSGQSETLYAGGAELIRVYGLADGKVLYFWAGLPEGGAAVCRLYIPEGRTDILYQITREELERYYYEPPAGRGDAELSRASSGYLLGVVEPVSNFEFTWSTVNREFCELYDSLALRAGDYPQYFDQGLEKIEIKFRIEADYGVREYTDHYYNALTGEHLTRQQSGYSNPVYPWWND